MTTRYYIGTGLKECYYTLRYSFSEPLYQRTEKGVECCGSIERDYHVRNLSIDRETAIAKAREITGKGMNADFEVCEIVKREEVDWSFFEGGKYSGKSIHEVAELDREYLCWACENLATSKTYAKTIELAKALVAHELADRAVERASVAAKAAEEAKALATAAAEIIDLLKRSSQRPGDFCGSMAEQLARGVAPRGRALDIVEDIFGRSFGRRSSKAYNDACDRARTILDPSWAQPVL